MLEIHLSITDARFKWSETSRFEKQRLKGLNKTINTFLDDGEENESAKHMCTVSTHEEVDGSSSCTQSTPFLSPSTVSGWGHGVYLDIGQLLLLHRGRSANILACVALRQPETDPAPPSDKRSTIWPHLLLLFCFRAAFLWVQFFLTVFTMFLPHWAPGAAPVFLSYRTPSVVWLIFLS